MIRKIGNKVSLCQDKDALIPMDPRELLIGVAIIAIAILVLFLTGTLLLVMGGILLFVGFLLALQILPWVKGIPAVVLGAIAAIAGLVVIVMAKTNM